MESRGIEARSAAPAARGVDAKKQSMYELQCMRAVTERR